MLFFLFSTSLLFSIWKGNRVVIRNKYKHSLTSLSDQKKISSFHYPHYIFTNGKQSNIPHAITTDFSDLCQEYFGIKTDLIINDQLKTLFYHPCSRMVCPPSYFCPTNDLSSAWLCENQGTKRSCKSYGVNDNNYNFYPVDPFDLSKGITIHFNEKSSNRSVNLTLTCEKSNLPKNHIKWTNKASIINKTLLIFGSTSKACIRPIIIPKIETSSDESEKTEEQTFSEKDEQTDSQMPTFITEESETESASTTANSITDDSISPIVTDEDSSSSSSNTEISTVTENPTFDTSVHEEESATFEITELSTEKSESTDEFVATETPTVVITEILTKTATITSVVTEIPTKTATVITDIPTSSATDSSSGSKTISQSEPCSTDDFYSSDLESSSSYDDDDDDGDFKEKSNFRYWLLIPIFIGSALFLYFVLGTIFVSIRDKSCHLPNRRFWRRCGKTCSKQEQEYTFKLISDSD